MLDEVLLTRTNQTTQQRIRPGSWLSCLSRPSRKPMIWKLLNVEQEIERKLTESMAMGPQHRFCCYFANPESKYFGLEKLKRPIRRLPKEEILV